MQTRLTYYYLNVSKPDDRAEYLALLDRMAKDPDRGPVFCAWGSKWKAHPHNEVEEIELDTGHLFDNQWNEAGDKGRRLFEWYEEYVDNKNIHLGYVMDLTPEMLEAKRNRYRCHFCAFQIDNPKVEFCPSCLGSQFLEEKDLSLTRLTPVTESYSKAKVPADRYVEYRAEQIRCRRIRLRERKANNRKSAERKLELAQIEFDGFTWCLDNGIDTNDLIFYSHTERFCYGWHDGLDDVRYSEAEEKFKGFPYAVDLKRKGGTVQAAGTG